MKALPLRLLLSLSLGLSSTLAAAQSPSHEASVEQRRESAKAKFRAGSEAYETGDYTVAIGAFLEADRLAPSAPLSFNIARAYERSGDVSGALRWYRDYLRRSPSAKNAGEVRARITALSQRLAQGGVQQLSVLSMPIGALVVIDGRAVGVTPFTADLALGKHRVSLALPGYQDNDGPHEVELSRAAPAELILSLPVDTQRAPPAVVARAASVNRGSGRRFGAVPWALLGGGAASLGGALGFELARRENENDAKAADNQLAFKKSSDAMTRDATTARILAGIGGTLLVTGGVMLLVTAPEQPPTRVGMSCTFAGCSAQARGSF